MKEDFLHAWWKLKMLPRQTPVYSTQGDQIHVLNYGQHNHNSGPDFLNARVKIGDTVWAGHIELHVFASDWNAHGHSNDPAYSNVILHVVWKEDVSVIGHQGIPLTCLELEEFLSDEQLDTYRFLIQNNSWIPCQKLIDKVSSIKIKAWLDRLTIERLEGKCKTIKTDLTELENDWEEVFYQYLLTAFGLKVNASAFNELAKSLPFRLLMKYLNNPLQIEALLLGQAGILIDDYNDEYPRFLRNEFIFLSNKHRLKPIRERCKFMRLRPANFPTIRLAQFAALLCAENHLFRRCLEANNIKEVQKLFSVEPAQYWASHYIPDKKTPKRRKRLGSSMIDLIIINTIIPFYHLYGMEMALPFISKKAVRFLEALKPERNMIINKWENLGICPGNAGESQSLLQLKSNYCNDKRCLDCSIGIEIIKSG